MNPDFIFLLLEYMKDDAISEMKERWQSKDANFWYHKGRSDAYQNIIDTIKLENKNK